MEVLMGEIGSFFFFLIGNCPAPMFDCQSVAVTGLCLWIWGVPEMGVPRNGGFIRENPTKIRMIGGYPYFRKPPYLDIDRL